MIWQKIRLDALFTAFFLTFLVADFYPHPKLGKSLTERTFLPIQHSLVESASAFSKSHLNFSNAQRPSSSSNRL